jgi:hypothetical protein
MMHEKMKIRLGYEGFLVNVRVNERLWDEMTPLIL